MSITTRTTTPAAAVADKHGMAFLTGEAKNIVRGEKGENYMEFINTEWHSLID